MVIIAKHLLFMGFGDWLRAARQEKGYSLRELSRLANDICTHSYISQLEQHAGGKKGAYQPDPQIVDALARALGKSMDEARLAAGYAPSKPLTNPTTIPELVAALESLGIECPQMFGGFPRDENGEGFREVVERIWLDIQLVTGRILRGRSASYIVNDLALHEINEMEDVPITELKKTS